MSVAALVAQSGGAGGQEAGTTCVSAPHRGCSQGLLPAGATVCALTMVLRKGVRISVVEPHSVPAVCNLFVRSCSSGF